LRQKVGEKSPLHQCPHFTQCCEGVREGELGGKATSCYALMCAAQRLEQPPTNISPSRGFPPGLSFQRHQVRLAGIIW